MCVGGTTRKGWTKVYPFFLSESGTQDRDGWIENFNCKPCAVKLYVIGSTGSSSSGSGKKDSILLGSVVSMFYLYTIIKLNTHE